MFADLSEAQLASVATGMHKVQLSEGEVLFNQGDRGDVFFMMLQGRMKVVQVTEDGHQFIVRIVQPGDMCGFVKALSRDTYPGTAIAMTDCVLLTWPAHRWEALMGVAPSLALSAIHAIGRKLDDAHNRLRELTTEEAEQRIARVVLRQAEEAGGSTTDNIPGDAPGDAIVIPYPLTRQDIADMSGSTLHTASRIMSGWERQGILARARRKVIVADMTRLRRIAAAHSD